MLNAASLQQHLASKKHKKRMLDWPAHFPDPIGFGEDIKHGESVSPQASLVACRIRACLNELLTKLSRVREECCVVSSLSRRPQRRNRGDHFLLLTRKFRNSQTGL